MSVSSKKTKTPKKPREPIVIDFVKLRNDLKILLDEVDLRLQTEFDAFSPYMWKKLQKTVDEVVREITAVRAVLDGKTSAEVAAEMGLKKQQVAAFVAYNTMWQEDYASPEVIIGAVECPYCGAGIGDRGLSKGNNDARVHDSRRQHFRTECKERALTTKEIRKTQEARKAVGSEGRVGQRVSEVANG